MDPEFSTKASDDYIDYKGRKADPKKHGGIRAACLVCVVEVMQSTVFLSNSLNLVAYFLKSMHYSVAQSSTMVTNFMGTSFLLSMVWGFVSDSYLTRFYTFLLSVATELLGIIILTCQARNPHLLPPENKTPSNIQTAVLYIGLGAMAIGIGGTKATLAAHGADQLDLSNRNLISSFFNWYFFCITTGGLIAASIMVWIEENRGWNTSFMIFAIVLCCSICTFASGFPLYRCKSPAGSPVTRIVKVFVASARNRKASPVISVNRNATTQSDAREQSNDKFKFLNKALIDGTIGVAQVEETKSFLGLLPIFATTIMTNCCMAQLFTFSVQQGNIMNRKLHNFIIPTPSISLIPVVSILAFICLFEQFKRVYKPIDTKNSKTNQTLARMGVGLALGVVSMAVAAIIEAKRLKAFNNGITLSIFWLLWQYILVGVSDTLTLGGMLEFFYSEAPHSMRSMCTTLSWCSSSMGYFLSSVLVAISNSISGRFGREWLGGKDLNHDRLDLFYTLICILNFINFLLYVYFARRY